MEGQTKKLKVAGLLIEIEGSIKSITETTDESGVTIHTTKPVGLIDCTDTSMSRADGVWRVQLPGDIVVNVGVFEMTGGTLNL